ncbi:hypothetical protein D3C78_1784500 [compost metagenome]
MAATAQRPHHAGDAQAAVDFIAPFGQLLGDQIAGHDFLVGELGMGMEVVAHGQHLVADRLHFRQDRRHGVLGKRVCHRWAVLILAGYGRS